MDILVTYGLIFLFVLLALNTQPIVHFVFPEIKFQSLKGKYFPPAEESECQHFGEVIVTSVLHLINLQFQCYLFVFLTLVSDHS